MTAYCKNGYDTLLMYHARKLKKLKWNKMSIILFIYFLFIFGFMLGLFFCFCSEIIFPA